MSERATAAQVLVELIQEHVPASKQGLGHSLVRRLLVLDDHPAGGCRACGERLPPYRGRGRPCEYCDEHAPKPRRKDGKKHDGGG